jgi:hypothetical protein
MASSFVKYHENGLWFRDGILRPTCSYIYKQMLSYENREDWFYEMAEKIKLNSWAYFNGFMNLGFDEYLTNNDRKKLLIMVINDTIISFGSKPEILDVLSDVKEYLNEELIEFYSNENGIPKSRIVGVLKYLLEILQDETLKKESQEKSLAI